MVEHNHHMVGVGCSIQPAPTSPPEAKPGPPPGPTRVGFWWRVALAFAASFGFTYHLQFQSPFIIGYDGYYHAKYAFLLRTLGLMREFKWAAHSLWATQFSDKEFLYHVYLIPFTYFDDLATGIKLASALMAAVALTSFFAILLLNRFRYPWLWYALLLGSGWFFLYRLIAARPHVVAIVLLLWTVHLIVNRRRRALAVVVFVYSLSYTGFVLPMIVAVIVSIHLFVTEREIDWKTPLVVLGTSLAGMLVNPFFPNNLRMFYVQNFYVPWMSLQSNVDLAMAGEFEPLETRFLVMVHLAVVLPCAGAAYLALVRPMKLDRKTTSLFVVACSLIGLTFMIRRFIEYSVPFTLLFLAAFYTCHLRGFSLRASLARGGRTRLLAAGAAAVVVLLTAGLFVRSYLDALPHYRVPEPRLKDSALYLLDHTEEDELVFTCDWDDTPALFFYNHRNRYPVFMDPNFMYVWNPEHWEEWYGIAHGDFGGRTYNLLAERYEYGVCTWDFEHLKWIVENDPRMEVVFDSGGSWVFRVDRDNPEISIDEFLRLTDDPFAAGPSEEEETDDESG